MVRPGLSLRFRVFALLGFLVMAMLGLGGVLFWHSRQMDLLFSRVIDHDVLAFEAAQELSAALVMQ